MVRHRVRGRLPDDLGAWMADLKDITNGAPPIPEPSEPTAWLSTDAAADLLAAAGVGIGDRQVRSLAASGELLARRDGHRWRSAGVRRGRDRCPPVLRPEVRKPPGSRDSGDHVRVTLYRPLPVIGGTMATWAEQQRRAKIAELVKQSRADERQAQALEDRIRYGNEGTFQEMWTRGLEEDVRQERAENDVREAKRAAARAEGGGGTSRPRAPCSCTLWPQRRRHPRPSRHAEGRRVDAFDPTVDAGQPAVDADTSGRRLRHAAHTPWSQARQQGPDQPSSRQREAR